MMKVSFYERGKLRMTSLLKTFSTLDIFPKLFMMFEGKGFCRVSFLPTNRLMLKINIDYSILQ